MFYFFLPNKHIFNFLFLSDCMSKIFQYRAERGNRMRHPCLVSVGKFWFLTFKGNINDVLVDILYQVEKVFSKPKFFECFFF